MTDTLRLNDVIGRIDFAVITIRSDEYQAVLDRFSSRKVIVDGKGIVGLLHY